MTAHASAAEHMARGLRQGLANAPGGSVSVRAAREIVVRLSRSISLAPRDRDPADGTVPNLLHALSHIVELEEQRYEDLCGDGGGSHRSGYPIGRILALVQEDHDVFERFAHAVIVSRDEEPAVLAASLRLARAVLSVTGFQFPLGEDAVVRRLEMLALGEDGNPNGNPNGNPHTQGAFGDAASAAAAAAAAAEAKRGTPAEALAASAARAAAIDALRVKTYAAACLAVALEAEDVASNFVRDGVMEKIMTPLRECIAEGKPAEGSDVARFALGAAADDSPFDPDAAARDVAGADAEVDAKVMVLRLLELGPTDAARLPERLTEARVRSLAAVGEYIESFGAAMRCGAVDVCLALVDGPPGGWPAACARRRDAGIADPTLPRLNGDPQLPESLAAVSALLAHRKFAVTFVDRGGVRALLALPRGPLTHNGFTQCLFGVSQITGAMERLLAPTSAGTAAGTTAARMCVDAALEALEGGHDAARRHAALFFSLSFPFPAILDAFDAAGGLRPLLNLLRHAAQVGTAATATAKQTASHACHALRQYARAHLHRRVAAASAGIGASVGARRQSSEHAEARWCPPPGHRAMDLGQAATDRNLRAAAHDPKVASAMQRAPWLVMDAFVAQGGHEIMLSLMRVAPGDRHFHDSVPAALATLRTATLHPGARIATAAATLPEPRGGGVAPAMHVLLEISARAMHAHDSEAVIDVMHIMCTLVAPPPALTGSTGSTSRDAREPHATTPSRRGKKNAHARDDGVADRNAATFDARMRPAREALREAGGIRALLSMLMKGARTLAPPNDDAARALCCRALLAMARDPAIAQTLQTLQVARRLTEMVATFRRSGAAATETKAAAAKAAEAKAAVGGSKSAATSRAAAAASTAAEAGAEFHRAAVELIAVTAGGAARGSTAAAASDAATAPLRRLERHAIAAATKIRYPHDELVQLIHEHLVAAGLHGAAAALAAEARAGARGGIGASASPAPASALVSSRSLPADAASGRVSGLGSAHPSTPGLTRRLSLPRRPGSGAAGLFGGGSKSATAGAFTLGLEQSNDKASTRREEKGKERARGESERKRARSAKRESLPAPTPSPAATRRSKRKASALSPPDDADDENPPDDVPAAARTVRAPTPSLVSPADGLLAGAAPGSSFARASGVTHVHFPGDGSAHTHHPHHHAHPLPPGWKDREGCGVKSKLDSIMTTYLRAQHRQCAAPIAACAPFSLLEPHACPEPRHLLNAPRNLVDRLARRERSRHPRGGPGGRARDRHFVYGRFRPVRAFRDRGDGPMFTCVAFVGADGDRALVGSDVSELLLYDIANGDLLERHDAQHADGDPRALRAAPLACPKTLVLSCGSEETHLWDAANMGVGPLRTFEGCRGAAFDADGSRVVVVGEDLVGDGSTGGRRHRGDDSRVLRRRRRRAFVCSAAFVSTRGRVVQSRRRGFVLVGEHAVGRAAARAAEAFRSVQRRRRRVFPPEGKRSDSQQRSVGFTNESPGAFRRVPRRHAAVLDGLGRRRRRHLSRSAGDGHLPPRATMQTPAPRVVPNARRRRLLRNLHGGTRTRRAGRVLGRGHGRVVRHGGVRPRGYPRQRRSRARGWSPATGGG